jgi:hypothetical protein
MGNKFVGRKFGAHGGESIMGLDWKEGTDEKGEGKLGGGWIVSGAFDRKVNVSNLLPLSKIFGRPAKAPSLAGSPNRFGTWLTLARHKTLPSGPSVRRSRSAKSAGDPDTRPRSPLFLSGSANPRRLLHRRETAPSRFGMSDGPLSPSTRSKEGMVDWQVRSSRFGRLS